MGKTEVANCDPTGSSTSELSTIRPDQAKCSPYAAADSEDIRIEPDVHPQT
jgi:hypothetical protein